MKRAFAWLAGLVGIAALGRWLARRTATAPAPPPEPAADPAAELRHALEARRSADAVVEDAAPPDTETLEQRRARIHAKAQEAIDAMKGPGE